MVEQLKTEPPYDVILSTLYGVESDISKTELIQLVAGKISSDALIMLQKIPDTVTRTVAYESLREIESEQAMYKIVQVMKSNLDTSEKLAKIRKLAEIRISKPNSNAKSINDFITEDIIDVLEIDEYPCSKGELVCMVAYSGRGKTTRMLSLVRLASELGMKCLYITIADWSESMLKHKIKRADKFPDFQAVCYSECDIHKIEAEIESVKPDLTIVDYLDVITPDNPFDAYRHQLRVVSQNLKRIAGEYNTLLITGKQANADDEIITANHLAEAKQGIIANCDLVLGYGKHPTYENTLNCSTIKVRRHPPIHGVLEIRIDHRNFEVD